MNATQRNATKVLERLIDLVKENEDDAKVISEYLELMLDELHQDDFFGTEGQIDPRGDFRNGYWTMKKVEGMDG